jgi:hypothetical protein
MLFVSDAFFASIMVILNDEASGWLHGREAGISRAKCRSSVLLPSDVNCRRGRFKNVYFPHTGILFNDAVSTVPSNEITRFVMYAELQKMEKLAVVACCRGFVFKLCCVICDRICSVVLRECNLQFHQIIAALMIMVVSNLLCEV